MKSARSKAITMETVGKTRLAIEYPWNTSGTPLFDRLQNLGNDFGLGLRPDVAFAVKANTDRAGFHVATANDQHGVDLGLLSVRNLTVDLIRAVVPFRADKVGTEFVHDGLGIVHQRFFIA